jgi:hypothetical protein
MGDLGADELTSAEKARRAAAIAKRINTEASTLRQMLRKGGIDEDRLQGVNKLVRSAAFLAVTLADLEAEINRDGCTSEYQNGENQWGTKQSPAVQSYSSLMQRYLAAMKQLIDLLPEGAEKPKSDDLLDFIGAR